MTRPGDMALIARRADDWRSGETCSLLTAIADGTGITISTRRVVRLGRIRAQAGRWITDSGVMTLIAGDTDHRGAACANTGLACIRRRTRVAVVAGAAICFGWVRADPGVGIADASVMTLVACGTNNRVIASTDALLASIGLCTGVTVVTSGTVSLCRIGTKPIGGIAYPYYMTLVERGADDRRAGYTSATLASIILSTSVTVCARRAVWRVYRRRTE